MAYIRVTKRLAVITCCVLFNSLLELGAGQSDSCSTAEMDANGACPDELAYTSLLQARVQVGRVDKHVDKFKFGQLPGCPECGDPADPASCVMMCGEQCSYGANDPACLACAAEKGCMPCHTCYMEKYYGDYDDGDYGPLPGCPECGDPADPASCFMSCGEECSNGANDPVCLACAAEKDCMPCHTCYMEKYYGDYNDGDYGPLPGCPECGDPADPASCFMSCGEQCSNGANDPACLACAAEKDCMPCHTCYMEKYYGDYDDGDYGSLPGCPECGDPADPASCFMSCGEECSNGANDPACLACAAEKDCMPCHTCYMEKYYGDY